MDEIVVRGTVLLLHCIYPEEELGDLGFWIVRIIGNKVYWSNGNFKLTTRYNEIVCMSKA